MFNARKPKAHLTETLWDNGDFVKLIEEWEAQI
jgi:hypothetical protein